MLRRYVRHCLNTDDIGGSKSIKFEVRDMERQTLRRVVGFESKELTPFAESYKVNIAIENVWNKFLPSPVEMKHFIDSIGSPYVEVYFDVVMYFELGFQNNG